MTVNTEWTPEKIRKLRGPRTQAELGKIIKVPKNTVWRWEAGQTRPDAERARRLDRVARRERHLEGWTLEGSATLLGDLEEGSRHLARHFKISPGRLTGKFE